MLKIFFIIIFILILIISILTFIIKRKNKNIKNLEIKNKTLEESYKQINNSYTKLNEEFEIERKHNQELAKKLADISCMSIDDVLSQLQNNNDNRKNDI